MAHIRGERNRNVFFFYKLIKTIDIFDLFFVEVLEVTQRLHAVIIDHIYSYTSLKLNNNK